MSIKSLDQEFQFFQKIDIWLILLIFAKSFFCFIFTFQVYMHKVITEDSLVKRSSEFETAVNTSEKSALRLMCERKSEDSV